MNRQAKKLKSINMPADLLSTYRNLSHLPGFALLKSDNRLYGACDIVTGLPYQSEVVTQVDDLLSNPPKNALFSQPSLGPFPFQGGIIGYLSYNFGALANGISLQESNPYVHLPLACLNWYRWCIVICHNLNTATLIYDTDADTLSKVEHIEALWFQSTDKITPIDEVEFEPLWSLNEYEPAFNKIQSALQAGRCYQVNLTQAYRLNSSATSWDLYEHIARKNSEPYGAFLSYEEHNILSFSPECFLTVDGDEVITRPIKGSIARCHENPQVDEALGTALKNSEKDKAENIMIVDLLRNDLSKIAQKGSVSVSYLCELGSYPEIHHLVSEIKAMKKKKLTAFDVLLSAFPGGSITGAPKIEAMKMISELELTTRGPYCGSVFYYSHHGRLDSNIAIRTITALENEYWLHAGGGIIVDSQLQQEYEECLIKLSAIINAIT